MGIWFIVRLPCYSHFLCVVSRPWSLTQHRRLRPLPLRWSRLLTFRRHVLERQPRQHLQARMMPGTIERILAQAETLVQVELDVSQPLGISFENYLRTQQLQEHMKTPRLSVCFRAGKKRLQTGPSYERYL